MTTIYFEIIFWTYFSKIYFTNLQLLYKIIQKKNKSSWKDEMHKIINKISSLIVE
jgi:hypothetical protein